MIAADPAPPGGGAAARFYRTFVRWEAWIAATFLVVMVALIFAGGVARMLGHPQNWTTDAALCLFAWAMFLSADIAWRRDSLMSIDLLTRRLPDAAQRVLLGINHLLIVSFLVYAIVMGTYLSWISRARSFQGIPEISYSWVTMSMPVGALPTGMLIVTHE
ncbi:MAG TPA: TRAP transporter small permease subunit [Burkholderiaceae bacterium]|nr:TRAP transporter small permease subunit [Burkholderiaceae bacterium]